jgi:hypothetical protein
MIAILNVSGEPRLHHVGFVVANLEASAPGMARALLTDWSSEIFTDPLQRVRVNLDYAGPARKTRIYGGVLMAAGIRPEILS